MKHKIASDFGARIPSATGGAVGRPLEVTPALAGWRYLSFHTYVLRQGQTLGGETAGDELCMVLLAGQITVVSGGTTWECERRDVFHGRPYAMYLPPGCAYSVTARADTEVACGRAPATGQLPPRLITPEQVAIEIRGGHNVTRQINHILDPGAAEKLLCVEVYTPSGNWSSYPPHRHDVDNPPQEVDLEEVYYYRVNPPDGWAMQRLYTDDRSTDEAVIASHGDVVLVRQGYHPVVAAPGYDVYYLNFLAGTTPSWAALDDPQLAWVRGNWAGREDRLVLPLQ